MPPVVMLAMAPISSTGFRMACAIGWKLACPPNRRPRRLRVEAAPARHLEVGMPGAAPSPQLATGRGGGGRLAVRRNRQSRHLHPHDGVGVTFVFGALAELLLLPAEEPRQARSMGAFEVAGPEIVRLHHVKVAVEDQIAVACHVTPPTLRWWIWESTISTAILRWVA